MLPCLKRFAHATPAWLMKLRPSDIRQGPAPWITKLVRGALVYPGAGTDGSPVRQCTGVIRSFIFADYGTSKASVLAEVIRSLENGTHLAPYDLVALTEFEPAPLLADAAPAFVGKSGFRLDPDAGFGIWTLFESKGCGRPERLSLLYFGAEGIQTLAALFPHSAPRALVIQEHGLGGNCWPSFAERVEELGKRWERLPRFLLGPNSMGVWRDASRLLGSDVAVESMWKEERELRLLNAGRPRTSTATEATSR